MIGASKIKISKNIKANNVGEFSMEIIMHIFKICVLIVAFSMPALAEEEDKDLPLKVTRYSDTKKFEVTNIGECPIYKLEMWTLPPNNSFWQRLSQSDSFKIELGTLEKNHYARFPFQELINDGGKRLDDGYVIAELRFIGSYCGEHRHLFLRIPN